MDDEILSQDEVDALINGVNEGDLETEESEFGIDDEEIKAVDFVSQERVVRTKFPVLERIHERLTKSFVQSIYNLMSRDIDVILENLNFAKFTEYMSSLSLPTGISIVRFHPLRGKGLIIFDSDLVYVLVENYFGGAKQAHQSLEGREFTIAEVHIMQLVVELLCENLKEAWRPVLDVDLEVIGSETNPQLVNINAATDVMLISAFQINFKEASGRMQVVMPYTMLEPIRELLDIGAVRSDDEVDPNWFNAIRQELLNVELKVSSILAKKQVNLGDICKMNSGEIIPIEIPDEISMDIEGIPSFKVKYGVSNDKCSLKIINQLAR